LNPLPPQNIGKVAGRKDASGASASTSAQQQQNSDDVIMRDSADGLKIKGKVKHPRTSNIIIMKNNQQQGQKSAAASESQSDNLSSHYNYDLQRQNKNASNISSSGSTLTGANTNNNITQQHHQQQRQNNHNLRLQQQSQSHHDIGSNINKGGSGNSGADIEMVDNDNQVPPITNIYNDKSKNTIQEVLLGQSDCSGFWRVVYNILLEEEDDTKMYLKQLKLKKFYKYLARESGL